MEGKLRRLSAGDATRPTTQPAQDEKAKQLRELATSIDSAEENLKKVKSTLTLLDEIARLDKESVLQKMSNDQMPLAAALSLAEMPGLSFSDKEISTIVEKLIRLGADETQLSNLSSKQQKILSDALDKIKP